MSSFLKILIFSFFVTLASCERAAPITNLQYDKMLGEPRQHNNRAPLPSLATDIAFDRANNRIISLQHNGDLLLWSEDGGFSETLAQDVSGFSYCAVPGAIIYTGLHGVRMVNIGQRNERILKRKNYEHIAIGNGCRRMALASEDAREIDVLVLDQPDQAEKIKTSAPIRNGLSMSSDGMMLSAALGTYDDKAGHKTMVEVFDFENGLESYSAKIIDAADDILGMWTMSFSPAGDRLFVPSQSKNKSGIRAFTPTTGTTDWAQNGFASYWVRALAVSPNGDMVATGDEKGYLRIWDATSGSLLAERQVGLVIQSLAFSSDGHELAIGLWNSQIGIIVVDKLFAHPENV